jgi:hypothetical protein
MRDVVLTGDSKTVTFRIMCPLRGCEGSRSGQDRPPAEVTDCADRQSLRPSIPREIMNESRDLLT